MAKIAQHSSATNEHYGPAWLIEGARELMGGIDLDPASCAKANEIVRASSFYALPNDGRVMPWHGRVYLNPPGGSCEFPSIPTPHNRKRDHASPGLWWAILAHKWQTGEIDQAVFTIFNLETLRYATGYPVLQPLDFPVLVPYERIDFLNADLEPQGSPAHPNMIVWLPPDRKPWGHLVDDQIAHQFDQAFAGRGKVFVSP